MQDTELILNKDGSIYHLNLLPEDIASTIITVGDPMRVSSVSQHFDYIEVKKSNREFVTHTGYLNSKRITVISTGIGTDNIDIVLNELDALVNVDFTTKAPKNSLTMLDIIRIGTSGGVREDLAVDSLVVSQYAVGLDGLLNFYSFKTEKKSSLLTDFLTKEVFTIPPYLSGANETLLNHFNTIGSKVITLTCPGFYAPQGRVLRGGTTDHLITRIIQSRNGLGLFSNLEMETAGIYGLSEVLGHRAISLNAILANRITGEFSKSPLKTVNNLITSALSLI